MSRYIRKTGHKQMEERAAGILLAVSSLPSPYGIGVFGKEGREWADFLAGAGQRYWQILPLGATGWGDSPYQSFSAFALSPYYIDLEALVEEGLLSAKEPKKYDWGADGTKVDYAALYRNKCQCLRMAYNNFKPDNPYMRFCGKTADWLTDYALFMTIKTIYGGKSFLQWPDDIKLRKKAALDTIKKENKELFQYYFFEQYIARKQWDALKEYVNKQGIAIIGDMPMYVAMDSSDVWSQRNLFQLNKNFEPAAVAGCPPDPFAKNGQIWGNPLYNWKEMKSDGYIWWRRRLQSNFSLFDILRIDHFRGFESYYAVKSGASSAKAGEWTAGPGADFIKMIHEYFPLNGIIAEDLGYQTPALKKFLSDSGFPGIKVLQFAFDSREKEKDAYLPYNYEANSVAYTGTHDNITAAGWPKEAKEADSRLAEEFLGVQKDDWARAFVKAALFSPSRTAVIPFQDYLGLGGEFRMNTPAVTGGGNWRYRIKKTDMSKKTAEEIRHLTGLAGRI